MVTRPIIFISRSLDVQSPLQKLRATGHTVIDESLINVSPIRFTHTPKSDWIFFSSRNAIHYFFSQNPVIYPNARFAVFGKGSADMLFSYGRKADFIGNGNDTTAIARQFISLLDGEIVLFPQAIDSYQTVQRWLPFNNIARNLFVYKTAPRTDFTLPEADILVFTSPSNVNAWFARYNRKMHQTFVAIGTTTKLSLRSKGVQNVHLPSRFDEMALLDLISELSRISVAC